MYRVRFDVKGVLKSFFSHFVMHMLQDGLGELLTGLSKVWFLKKTVVVERTVENQSFCASVQQQ